MPSTKRVDLSQAMSDTPQLQASVSDLEASVAPFKDFVLQLKETCQALHSHQTMVAESMSTFATILSSVDHEVFGEKDAFMAGSLKQLGKHLLDLHSWQEMLCTQLDHAVVHQLDAIVTSDITKLGSLRETFESSHHEHETAMAKYSRVSKKKETERSRFDANSELFTARKTFHQVTHLQAQLITVFSMGETCYQSCPYMHRFFVQLQNALTYYSQLNNFQLAKKYALLEPLLALMHSQLAYFKMGHEILTDEVGKFLTTLNVEIQRVRNEHDQLAQQQRKKMEALEQQSAHLCIPDPDPSDPFIDFQAANLRLMSKSGYLFHKQQGGIASKWERIFFFTKDHLLCYQYSQSRVPEMLLDLTTEGLDASVTDIDDRRYTFQLVQAAQSHKPMYFQCENPVVRDEWVATFKNILKKSQSQSAARKNPVGGVSTVQNTDKIKQERERVRTFVDHLSVSTSAKHTPEKKSGTPNRRANTTAHQAPPVRKRQSQPTPMPVVQPRSESTSTDKVQALLALADSGSFEEGKDSGYLQSFTVRFLGSTEVGQNKGVQVVKETIRRVIAARAIKNIMSTYSVSMVVTHKSVTLVDNVSGRVSVQMKLKDISYSSKHPDNERLFAIISQSWSEGRKKFVCHVFEADVSGKAICQAIIDAIKTAVKMVTNQDIPSAGVTAAQEQNGSSSGTIEPVYATVIPKSQRKPDSSAAGQDSSPKKTPALSIPKSLSSSAFQHETIIHQRDRQDSDTLISFSDEEASSTTNLEAPPSTPLKSLSTSSLLQQSSSLHQQLQQGSQEQATRQKLTNVFSDPQMLEEKLQLAFSDQTDVSSPQKQSPTRDTHPKTTPTFPTNFGDDYVQESDVVVSGAAPPTDTSMPVTPPSSLVRETTIPPSQNPPSSSMATAAGVDLTQFDPLADLLEAAAASLTATAPPTSTEKDPPNLLSDN